VSIILHIETATTMCSVALSKNNIVLCERNINNGYTHAENLGKFIRECMREAQLEMNELSAISVSKGPGSYTGLRIGVSTAKGIAYALGIPLIGVPTLKNMAMHPHLLQIKALKIPMIDARRAEVFCAVFDEKANEVSSAEAVILDAHSFSDLIQNQAVCVFGDGSPKAKEILAPHPNLVFADDITPLASSAIEWTHEAFLNSNFEDTAYFEPFYLKDFVGTTPKAKV